LGGGTGAEFVKIAGAVGIEIQCGIGGIVGVEAGDLVLVAVRHPVVIGIDGHGAAEGGFGAEAGPDEISAADAERP
jgi:hypothetical protein